MALLLPLLLALGGAAHAGSTSSWSRVTDTNLSSIDETGLARTRDGVLHVVWPTKRPGVEVLRQATIKPSGKVGAATTAVPNLRGLSNPDLVLSPDGGLQLFYSAIVPAPPGIRMSTAGATGTGWSDPAKVSFDDQGGEPGATLDKGGTPIFAWSAGANTYFHVGTNPSEKDVVIGPAPLCCYYNPEVAVDQASGNAFVAYFSLVAKRAGIFVRQILPSLGPPRLAPRAVAPGGFIAPDHRTPLVARAGGGVYLAYCSGYPSCTQVLLWRIGGAPRLIAKGPDIEDVNLTRGPDGRLWVIWQDGTRRQFYAARTNKPATKVGAIVTVPPPPGTSAIWDVFGEGSLGPLDLLAHVSTRGSLATWHRQVLPGLSLSCAARRKKVTCAVKDAGDPVARATVKVGGKTARTGARGTASTTVRRSGLYRATATRRGYAPAIASIRVR